MKKIFFLTAMLTASLLIKAQKAHEETHKAHVELGLKGGLNVATLSSPAYNYSIDPRISANFGGLAHIHLSKEFAIQPELLFSGQGAKQTNEDRKVVKTNLNYLQIPVLLQYLIGTGFRLETGPQFGFLLSANRKVDNVTANIKDAYKTIDVAWVFGAGYLTPSGFGIDARYNLGLSNINNLSDTKLHNRVFSIGVFYQFEALKH